MKAKLSVIAGAGTLAGLGAVWLAAHQSPGRPTDPGPLLTLLVGVSLLGCGLASWRARPDNRLGQIMVLTGFAWFAIQLIEASPAWLNTIGLAVQAVWIVGLVWMLLSFPSGRLTRRLDRCLVAIGVFAGLGLQLLAMLDGNKAGLRCPGCANNLLQIAHDNEKALGLLNLQRLVGAVLIVLIVGLLIKRWLQASAAQRRVTAPVVVAGCATLAALAWTVVFDLLGDPLGSVPADVYFTTMAAVPVAVMFVFLQRRLARGMVAGLVVELGGRSASPDLRSALARALGDPSLQLAFWFPAEQRYVDGDGRVITLPEAGSGRGSTFVANERLQAELRARLVELQASRARLVQATDAERRRIERDLHDGTQQRLVSIAMSLGLLETRLPAQATGVQPLVRETREALALALAELRELTHGINPPLLAERGLSAALEELCRRAPLPTHLELALDRRLPSQIETAAYFTASEALTNAAKHSHGKAVRVAAACDDHCLTVKVTDDGIGGASAVGGSGLRGLGDRVEALGGRFTVSSPPGRGTTLEAEIPCA